MEALLNDYAFVTCVPLLQRALLSKYSSYLSLSAEVCYSVLASLDDELGHANPLNSVTKLQALLTRVPPKQAALEWVMLQLQDLLKMKLLGPREITVRAKHLVKSLSAHTFPGELMSWHRLKKNQ